MNWDTGTWDSGLWDEPPTPPASDYFKPRRKTNTHTTMKRQDYYPSRIGDQVNWLDNFSVKLPIHGPTLGVEPADVTASVNDAKFGNYVLGTWLSAVRNFSPSTTDAVDDVLTGAGGGAIVLPTFTAPALPAGVTATLPGLLTRIFALITKMKLSAGYTEAIGTDLGIVGIEGTEKATPKFLIAPEQGDGCQCVKLTSTSTATWACTSRADAARARGSSWRSTPKAPTTTSARCWWPDSPRCASTGCASGTKARRTVTGRMCRRSRCHREEGNTRRLGEGETGRGATQALHDTQSSRPSPRLQV
jgi:hypothetical protein